MNQRSIALGASVVALALAGPATAEAGVLGGVGSGLPDTGVAVNVQANVKTNVKANPDLPLPRLPKHSPTDGGTTPSVKVKGEAKSTGSGVGAGFNAQAGNGKGTLDSRAGFEQNARLKGIVHGHSAKSELSAAEQGNAKLDTGRHHGSAAVKAKGDARIKTRSHTVVKPRFHTPKVGGGKKDVVPIHGIGREVGNPIQLSLAGWLIALTGAACLGASRIVRRLQGSRL